MTFYGDASKNASPCGQAGFYDHFIAGFLAKIPSIFPVKLGLSARAFDTTLPPPPFFLSNLPCEDEPVVILTAEMRGHWSGKGEPCSEGVADRI